MLSVLREMLEVEREPPEVEFATLSLLREQLSVFVGTPESHRGWRTEWRGALSKLRGTLSEEAPV